MRTALGVGVLASFTCALVMCGGDDPVTPQAQEEAGPVSLMTSTPNSDSGFIDAGPVACSTDVLHDSKNCGRRGHDCLGAPCSEGMRGDPDPSRERQTHDRGSVEGCASRF